MVNRPGVAARVSQLVAYLATCTILGLLAGCGSGTPPAVDKEITDLGGTVPP
jgi:hypothetical protein